MTAENISVEDVFGIVRRWSAEEKLRFMALLISNIPDDNSSTPVKPDSLTEVNSASKNEFNARTPNNTDEEIKDPVLRRLWGAWEHSMPDNIIEVIREKRVVERDAPNFDAE